MKFIFYELDQALPDRYGQFLWSGQLDLFHSDMVINLNGLLWEVATRPQLRLPTALQVDGDVEYTDTECVLALRRTK